MSLGSAVSMAVLWSVHYIVFHLYFTSQEMLDRNIDSYWIGLHDMEVENEFVWVGDDTATDYLIWWLQNEPNNGAGREDCVHTHNVWPFRWRDKTCGTRMSFACQASPTIPTTTTATTTTTQEPLSTTYDVSSPSESVPQPVKHSDEISTGVAVAIIIAVVVVIAVVVAAFFVLLRRRQHGSYGNMGSPAEGFENVTYNTSDNKLVFPNKA